MASLAFAAGVQMVSDNDIAPPEAAKSPPYRPSNKELDAIELPDYGLTSPGRYSHAVTSAGSQTLVEPETPDSGSDRSRKLSFPDDLERSQPPTPKQNAAAVVVPSFMYPRMNKYRVLSACLEYFGNGVNDSAPGALLPYIERWYHIGYAIVSLIWISNAFGFIAAAFSTDFICARLGRARSLMLSETFMIIGYTVIASPVPFPAVVVAYAVLGFGNALNIALNNVFCANLSNSTVILGAAHGSYGIGGIVGPILVTALVSNGVHWARFYLITIGIRLLCVVATGWSFWNYEKEATTGFSNSLQQIVIQQSATGTGEASQSHLIGRALKNRVTLIGALMIFAYQGGEVSESGWFISYLAQYRGGNLAQVGYVTSGFWAGITLGRFVLTHAAHRVGERLFVFALGAGVIIFQLIAWFVPNVIGDAVAVAILGLLLGPVYPCAATVFTRLLPANIQVIAIGLISSAGSSGGAVVPFLTGLLSQVVGTFVMNPVCIGAYVLMMGCWAGLPHIRKRTE